MASVNGTSSSSMTSMLGLSGKGIGGLATGLDTDSLVAALTSGTQSKIAKQGQQKQLLNWKMTAYRTMATALNAFQSKFLKISTSTASNTNITSNSFFNTYKATSSSDKVSVSATSGAITGNFTINEVTRLAEAESFTSKNKMSTTLSMNFSNGQTYDENSFKGETLKLEVDGFSTKTIKLDALSDPALGVINSVDGSVNTENFQKELQKLINAAYNSSSVVQVKRDATTGEISLDSSSARITVNADNDLLGLKAGKSNRVTTKDTTIEELAAFENIQGDVLTFNINGVEISVNKRDTIESLLTKVTNSSADVRMEYDKYNDVFTLTSKKMGADSKIEMRDVQGNLLSEIFGAQSGNSIGTDLLTRSDSISFNAKNQIDFMNTAQKKELAGKLGNMSFEMTINGVTKTVKVDAAMGIGSTKLNSGDFTAEEVYNAINKGIKSAFYGTGVEFGQTSDGRTIVETSKGEAFNFKASGEFAKILGMTDGSSITAGNIITDYGYGGSIGSFSDVGYIDAATLGITSENPGVFSMTINGVTRDVKVTPAKDSDGNEVAITNDNFLSRLNAAVKETFGSDAANVNFSATYTKEDVYTTLRNPGDFDFVDGNADDSENGYFNRDGVRIADKDGHFVDRDGNKIVSGQKTTGVRLTLNVPPNAFGVVETSVSIKGDLLNKVGLTSAAVPERNNISNSSTAATFAMLKGGPEMDSLPDGEKHTITVNGETVTYTKDTKIQDFLNELNEKLAGSGSAGIKDGKLFITAKNDNASSTDNSKISISDTGDLLKNVFGIDSTDGAGNTVFATEDASYTSATYKEGVNALVKIDDRELEWSSNNINYNGVNLTLHDTTLNANGVHEAIKIGVQADPDDVIKRIKEWMDDYNALVFTLNSAINEGKNRDYAPLTDEQKSSMTDDQIKTWEAEAKKGVLRSDQTLRQILADMRGTFYQKVESAGISLYDIGIVTKSGLSDPNQAGQLEFDPNISGGGEARLRDMLINNPDKVRLLFTDSENGIGVKLNNIITQAASTSSVNRGTLVRIAGTEQLTGDNTSQIGNKISAIDKYITTLKARLKTEYNRYWKQFSTLETSVQKMNTQSSWLTSQ